MSVDTTTLKLVWIYGHHSDSRLALILDNWFRSDLSAGNLVGTANTPSRLVNCGQRPAESVLFGIQSLFPD